jgi:hypothetical protein
MLLSALRFLTLVLAALGLAPGAAHMRRGERKLPSFVLVKAKPAMILAVDFILCAGNAAGT